jgi:hypothetical protein
VCHPFSFFFKPIPCQHVSGFSFYGSKYGAFMSSANNGIAFPMSEPVSFFYSCCPRLKIDILIFKKNEGALPSAPVIHAFQA